MQVKKIVIQAILQSRQKKYSRPEGEKSVSTQAKQSMKY